MLSNEVPSMFVWGRLLIAGIQQALEEASKRSEKKSHVPLAFMTPTPPTWPISGFHMSYFLSGK